MSTWIISILMDLLALKYLENCIYVQRLEFRLRLGIWRFCLLRGHSGPVSALSDFPGLRTNPSTWHRISDITEIKIFSQSPLLSSDHVSFEKEVGWNVTWGWQNQHRFHFHTRSNGDTWHNSKKDCQNMSKHFLNLRNDDRHDGCCPRTITTRIGIALFKKSA